MSKFEGFINATSYSSSKASSTLPHIQARRLNQCFLICKFKSFIFLKPKKKKRTSSLLLQVQSLKALGFIDADVASPSLQNVDAANSTSSQICCSQEDHHLKYVAIEKVVILNMLQLRRSSSQICCNREAHHLKYVAAKKIFISNRMQPRRSSSQICCS